MHVFEARWNRYRPTVADRWRESALHGGGVLLDLGTHLIDQALVLFGMPDWLQADIYTQRAGATVDDAFELRMGKGRMRIVLGAGALAAAPGPRYRVHGELGSYTSDALDPQEDQLRAGMLPADRAFGVPVQGVGGSIVDGATGRGTAVAAEAGRWSEYYRALRRAIEAGGAPPVGGMQARQVLQVIEAARQSSQRGARVWLEGRP